MVLTHFNMIHIRVEDNKGNVQDLEIPEGINLNLMETLKAFEYEIRATCGGMAHLLRLPLRGFGRRRKITRATGTGADNIGYPSGCYGKQSPGLPD